MVFCPGCGSDKVKNTNNDDKIYPHPTAAGISERFVMILCNSCGWSWNSAGSIHNGKI